MQRAEQITARALSYNGPVFKTDRKGRQVRVFNDLDPLTREVVRGFYIEARRACEEEEALLGIGEHGFRYAVQQGFLSKLQNGMYAVTKKAAEAYDLPKPRLFSGEPSEFML